MVEKYPEFLHAKTFVDLVENTLCLTASERTVLKGIMLATLLKAVKSPINSKWRNSVLDKLFNIIAFIEPDFIPPEVAEIKNNAGHTFWAQAMAVNLREDEMSFDALRDISERFLALSDEYETIEDMVYDLKNSREYDLEADIFFRITIPSLNRYP